MEAYGIPNEAYGSSTPTPQTSSFNMPRNPGPSSAQSSFRESQSSPLSFNSLTGGGQSFFSSQSLESPGLTSTKDSLKRKADVHDEEKSEQRKKKREKQLRKAQDKAIKQSQVQFVNEGLIIQPPEGPFTSAKMHSRPGATAWRPDVKSSSRAPGCSRRWPSHPVAPGEL